MAVQRIELIETIDNEPDTGHYDELPQGSTFTKVYIYKIVNADGADQFFKIETLYDSYARPIGSVPAISLVAPKTKTVVVFE